MGPGSGSTGGFPSRSTSAKFFTMNTTFTLHALHWLLHRVPALWRLHAVHHSDIDYDFTTALRFHPVEALVTASWSLAVVAALGPPI